MPPGQRRLHQARQHRVYPDSRRGEFQGAVLRQHLHPGLGGGISRAAVHRHMRVQGCDVDDRPAPPLRHHLPSLVLHAEEHAFQAEIDGEVPVPLGQIDDIAGPRAAGDVEGAIEAAEPVHRRRDQCFQIRFDRHVAAQADETFAQFGFQRVQPVRGEVRGDNAGALGQQPAGDGKSDAGGTAGDHCGLACKPGCHGVLPDGDNLPASRWNQQPWPHSCCTASQDDPAAPPPAQFLPTS